jgi:microcystin degradation protein MlrC
MRVAVGLIYHESNTFCPQRMTLEKFQEKDLHFGPEIFDRWTGTCSEMGGFIEGARRFGFEIIPTLAAWGMPAGPLTAETFDNLTVSLCSRLQEGRPIDGILLALHGAMVTDSFADADGEILRRVRISVGPNIPLVVTLDYHANVSHEMVRYPDAIVGYDTYPHVDQAERGLEAAQILDRMLEHGFRTKVAFARRPLLLQPLRQLTEDSPMSDAILLAHDIELQPALISVSIAAGFPYADVPDAGFSVYAVTRDDADAGLKATEEVADFVWARRAEFSMALPSAKAAVGEAMAQQDGLTIMADVGDNLGAGTPGDGTILLSELLQAGARGALVLLCDPEAVAAAIHAGVRQRIRLAVGAKSDKLHGAPVEIQGTVRTLSDGIYQNIGPMRDGVIDDQGRTAVIDTGGILVVLTERRMPMWNLQQLRTLGIEPTRLRIVAVKSAVAYRAAYKPIARRIIEVDTPGLSAANLGQFDYKQLRRPIYPLDPL